MAKETTKSSAWQEIYDKEFSYFEQYSNTPEENLQDNIYKYLKDAHTNEDLDELFNDFYKFFYDRAYEYDINGYNLILFSPASFSAFSLTNEVVLDTYLRDSIVMAVDYSPHEIQVSKSTIDLTSSLNFIFPTDTEHGGDISITYLDTDDLKIYAYHSLWLKYIFYVNMGYLKPASKFIENNTIDYMGSVYSLKFKSDMKTPVLATKAMGVFPNSLPIKETMGTRGEHQVTLTTVNYTTLYYMDEVVGKNANSQIYGEIRDLFTGTQ